MTVTYMPFPSPVIVCFINIISRNPPSLDPHRDMESSYSTRMTTFHPRAPASRMAQARQPRRRRLMTAFQPFSAQKARTRISMSEPNCRARLSWCMLCSAPFFSPKPSELALLSPVLVRLDTGLSGISCACGCGRKPVMQSTTSTFGDFTVVVGVKLGIGVVEE